MLRKLVLVFCIGLLMGIQSTAFASTLSAQLSNDAARIMYTGGALGGAFSRMQLEAGGLYDDGNNYLVMAGLVVRGENLDAPVIAGLGMRGYFGSAGTGTIPKSTVTTIALGGDVTYSPISLPGFEFSGYLYISPDQISFGDSSELLDYGITAGYQIIPLSTIFIGYVSLEVEIENQGKVAIDDGFVFGIKITF